MSDQVAAQADWKAPQGDGDLLIWPRGNQLLEQAAHTHDRLGAETGARIQNVPLADLRSRQRQSLGIAPDEIAIFSGHQTELYHPGVWAKDVLSSIAARKLGGGAYHVAVDTDQPKHISLRWPRGSAPITDDPRMSSAAWSGLLNTPSPAYLNELHTLVAGAARDWSFSPLIFDFLSKLAHQSVQSPSLSADMAEAMRDLDEQLGVNHRAILASSLFDGPAYLAFVHHLMARAGDFAPQYNTALAEYRRAAGIKSATRPMPDLVIGDNCCEVPFWQDDLNAAARSRGRVKKLDGQWALLDFRFDPALDGWEAAHRLAEFLQQHRLRLSPRALTLTLFMRLFMADQFVHGIGGARYDQVTDTLISRHFRIPPPPFCVTTATLFFPEAAGQSRVCLPCMQVDGHRLSHAVLGPEKTPWLTRIAAAPRHSPERQAAFAQMHGTLAKARPDHAGLRKWEAAYKEATQQHTREQAWFDRELFYAIQPADRLSNLIARYDAAFG
jgi:hypothetical protein